MPRACRPVRPALRGRAGAALAPLVALLAVAGCSQPTGGDPSTAPLTPPAVTPTAASPSATGQATPGPGTSATVDTVATGLDVPWATAFLPDGSALVTLRDRGELLQVRDGAAPVSLGVVPGVRADGEGGLLGVAVSPRFATDHQVFVYFTAARDNRVARLTFTGGAATGVTPVLTGIPKARNHNGGRLAFGPDGYLYVTTGDAGHSENAQDRASLGGKILRVRVDGSPAPGNPFGDSPVWSYGHRNVQGIAWAPDGAMYASEFGQDTWDELNRIEPGRNYGWPTVEGRAGRSGFVDPLVQWPTADASPSGIAVLDGAVYLAALRGQSLWRIPLEGKGVGAPARLLDGVHGRLRDVVAAPDGRLWVTTSNTFRGTPRAGDDRILALPPGTLR